MTFAGSARASDDDDLKTLIADCGGPNLQFDDVKPCLERARVLDESRPTPELLRLMTQLEQRLEEGESANGNSQTPSTTANGSPHSLGALPEAAKARSDGLLTGATAPLFAQAAEPQAIESDAEQDGLNRDMEASRVDDSDGGAPSEIAVDDPGPPPESGPRGPHG
jgi:hypothetical protein